MLFCLYENRNALLTTHLPPPLPRYHLPDDHMVQLRKYRVGEFGACPRVACEGQPVLPIGLKDALHIEGNECKVYCAKCDGVFEPAPKQLNWREKCKKPRRL